MLVNGKEVLNYAKKNKIAVPAFGVVNLEGAKSVCLAAEKVNVPVIIQMTEGGIKYGGLEELFSLVYSMGEKTKGQICLHLDHGRDINLIKKAIDLGFTSIMYDGSNLPIDENIKNTKEIKDYIGNRSVSLEVEIGQIGGKEDDIESEENKYADINDVIKMNKECDPDSIAVAVGTQHGIYKGEIKLNYDLIQESFEKTTKPIVLHGTSGVPSDMVRKAIKKGIRKVNYDTELKQKFIYSIKEYLDEHQGEYDIRKIFTPAINEVEETVLKRIEDCTVKGD